MNPITIDITVQAPIAKVWEYWTKSEHITKWSFASDDWECPRAENDLQVGGRFTSRMQSKENPEDGFDFGGTYTEIKENELIEYDLDDGRHVKVEFSETDDGVKITETFDPENENTEELQRNGWLAILANFKKHVEEE